MRIDQLIKKVNNTELGKTGTHETYVQVPNEWDVSSIFSTVDKIMNFVDKKSNNTYQIRLTEGREQRICGLGQFYRDSDLSAGDEVLFEKRCLTNKEEYLISSRKLKDTIVLRKDSKGFEVLTPPRLKLLTTDVIEKESRLPLSITFKKSAKKRNDSKEETDYYSLMVGDNPIKTNFKNKDFIEIEVRDNVATIRSGFIWKTISVEQGV